MASTSPARRGRPATYSREQIVRDLTAAVLADPAMPLTVSRLAAAVGMAPMSLYRHFRDREDLVVAVAHYVFAEERPAAALDSAWQEQIRVWMRHTYAQAIRVPQLVALIATGSSPAWASESAHLATILAAAGFGDGADLAEAVYWVATSTMGHAMIAAAARDELDVPALMATVPDLAETDARRMRDMLDHMAAMHGREFERVVDWTVAALERELGARTQVTS